MAKIEYERSGSEDRSAYTIAIEARPWALGGDENKPFYIGSGVNFHANGTIWVELIYSVAGAQVFYTRNFLQLDGFLDGSVAVLEKDLDEILREGSGHFALAGMFPETCLELKAEKGSYEDSNDEQHEYTSCNLTLSADVGVVFSSNGPGGTLIQIILNSLAVERGVQFFRDLIHEIAALQQGKHPDPAIFPDGSSEWPFALQLNRKSYNRLAADYDEDYFSNERLEELFTLWTGRLPKGGRVLDAGCGHGQPVITRLLERGFQVTGSDFSTEMLNRAARQFPGVTLIEKPVTQLAEVEVYDGVCSFNSVLYLDPIDLLHSIRRLHQALKPGGLLFLYAYDSGPDWRGEPLRTVDKELTWGWHYGWKEAGSLLEEHGYFRVLENRVVALDPEDEERVAREREKQKQEMEEFKQRQADNPERFPVPFLATPIEHRPYAYAIIARKCKRKKN